MTGTTETWTCAAGNGNLNDPKNWSLNKVPVAGDTAEFAGPAAANLTASMVNTGGARFAPSTIDLRPGEHVMFQGNQIFHFNTVNVGYGSDLAFNGSALEAATVNNAGLLDISKAGYIGLGDYATGNRVLGMVTGTLYGFGDKPLSAIIQNYTSDATGILPPGNPGRFYSEGAIGFGNNNAAIYSYANQYDEMNTTAGHGGPSNVPTGSGGMYDTSVSLIGPAPAIQNSEPGYAGAGAYTAALSGTSGQEWQFLAAWGW